MKKNQTNRLYILHGWTYSIDRWDPFVEKLEEKGFDVVLLKIPGLTEKIDRPWTLDDYTNWLEKTLSNDDKVILLGHSNGGRLAAKYASLFPEKIQQLILMDSAGIYDKRVIMTIKKFIFYNAALIGKYIFIKPIAKKLLYKMARVHDYENANPIMKITMKNLIKDDLSEVFKKINIPTIIIWGKHDKATPFEHGKQIHKLIKNSKFFPIDTARHSPMFTHQEKVVEIITQNLNEKVHI